MNDRIRGFGLVLATSVLMLLVGCVTPGGYGTQGGYGGVPGGYGQPSPGHPPQYDRQLQGTVDGVDPRNARISVVVNDQRTGRGQRTEVRYDQRTRLVYQGREHPVDGLERGDVIRVDVTQSGRELWARSIEVIRNVRDSGYGGGYGDDRYGGGYGNDLRGSIAFVDTRTRIIRLDGAGYGNNSQVAYDGRTTVEYQGRTYRPENLQRGDVVRIQARQVGNNQWLAERVIVERSVGR
ncbi:MAG: DUF5666 domain-containing protein [Lysobacter sp.]